ncbi:MAG: hypothetical protein KAX49_11800 [Halanaerobiales bacterium]|nr:hypothetical protein [Halanaerobiales bacterium]
MNINEIEMIEFELYKYPLPDIKNINSLEVQALLWFLRNKFNQRFKIKLNPKRAKLSICYLDKHQIEIAKDTYESAPLIQWIVIVHELIHLTGLNHDYKGHKLGYYSDCDRDIYSPKKTLELVKEYYKDVV